LARNRKGGSVSEIDDMMSFWTNLLGLTAQNGWKVTWGLVDQIPHPEGGNAVGLNQTNGETMESHISIRRPKSLAEQTDLDDTCAHEAVHCLGVRMQYLLDAGREVDAHEYLAETLAPAMVKIKGTPKAKFLAKAARNLPARAKGTRMDTKAILAMLAMIDAASTPEEKAKLLAEMKAQLEASAGTVEPAMAAAEVVPPVAKPPEPLLAAPSTDMGMRDDEALQKSPAFKTALGKAVDAILEAHTGLTDSAKAFAKKLGTPEAVGEYLKTLPKVTELAKPSETLGLGAAPRGGAGNTKGAPSADSKVNALFRIMPADSDNDGVTFHDGKAAGKLVEFSVVGAFAKIKASTAKAVAEQKVRMIRGAA
jgi:hypothetical protein